MNWPELQQYILSGLAMLVVVIPASTGVILLAIKQYEQIAALWRAVQHHDTQLNSGMDARIQAAVEAALQAASKGATPAEASLAASRASTQVHDAQAAAVKVHA